ncbi:unnamed protein product [Acanthoscelides obtectus]|uniref:Uncharacterized protein n=1 Tax=Acanthoscelides obtectus TaxID=200917 RepID=A0A9P0PA19_ACAOB|nr:unnamed protein product [Acanthoscelides obtectus]CAK1647160.1 hypothetical protein AOBTE_LOCUS15081 [Acanthoscelides obtectus]
MGFCFGILYFLFIRRTFWPLAFGFGLALKTETGAFQ